MKKIRQCVEKAGHLKWVPSTKFVSFSLSQSGERSPEQRLRGSAFRFIKWRQLATFWVDDDIPCSPFLCSIRVRIPGKIYLSYASLFCDIFFRLLKQFLRLAGVMENGVWDVNWRRRLSFEVEAESYPMFWEQITKNMVFPVFKWFLVQWVQF